MTGKVLLLKLMKIGSAALWKRQGAECKANRPLFKEAGAGSVMLMHVCGGRGRRVGASLEG